MTTVPARLEPGAFSEERQAAPSLSHDISASARVVLGGVLETGVTYATGGQDWSTG